jgi:GntR family transcriptional regulator/MocR family aminotransferase
VWFSLATASGASRRPPRQINSRGKLAPRGGLTPRGKQCGSGCRRRLDAALAAVATSLPDAVPKRVAAGLHMYVQLPDWCDELRLVDAAYKRGIFIEGASWHWSVPGSAPPALVLGYGTIDEPSIRAGFTTLAAVYEEHKASFGNSL